MRRVPGLKPGTLVAFVPEAFGNRGEAEPVRVWLKAPSEADRRAHLAEIMERVDVTAASPGSPPKLSLTFADILERKRKAILRFVDKVENYTGQDEQPIVTAADLWERGELAVCNEVDEEIERLLALGEPEKKGSAASSGSTEAVSSPTVGGVTTAAASSPASATATGGATLTY